MKQDDFERLKAICEREGFELGFKYDECTYTVIKKRDPWEDVEFVECIEEGETVLKGRVYKVLRFLDWYNETGISIHDDVVSFVNMSEKHFTPSTESAYVEQLKKEAFERFGEIKEGDKFIEPDNRIQTCCVDCEKWDYHKKEDQLFFYNVEVYNKGKWAKRVKERVKVEWYGGNIQDKSFYFMYDKKTEEKLIQMSFSKAGEFLASQLEKYLNREIE